MAKLLGNQEPTESSANDRGAAHAHAYDRHAIVTTIEQQYTRALVHLFNLQIRAAQRARELELSHVDENELQDDDHPTSS